MAVRGIASPMTRPIVAHVKAVIAGLLLNMRK